MMVLKIILLPSLKEKRKKILIYFSLLYLTLLIEDEERQIRPDMSLLKNMQIFFK